MEQLELNETPIRTARNFNINDIKLDNVNFPINIDNFNNIQTLCNIPKTTITGNTSNINLKYGVGNSLLEQVINNSNVKLQIKCENCEKEIKQELQINFILNKDNVSLIDDIEIISCENSQTNIIIKYESDEDLEFWHNGVIRVFAKKNSKLNIVLINLINIKSNNFISFENEIEDNADVRYTIIDFGGKNSITNYYSNIIGDNANNIINTIYLGNKDQLFDINYIGELRGKSSNIEIEVQGALADIAKKHFKGTIDFKKGCKKSKGNENEDCMLLSDKAKSLALPMLLCSEEDIEGNHSSSAGKVGEKELFYIMSRGFELKEAMKLMVKAKFNKILENINNNILKKQIIKEIDKRLD